MGMPRTPVLLKSGRWGDVGARDIRSSHRLRFRGLSAHLVGSVDGNFYRGISDAEGDGYSVFRTTNAGLSWTEHPLPTQETGTADTWNAEEAQVEVDSEGNVHANGWD